MNLAGLLGATKDLGPRLNLLGVLPGGTLALFVLALLWSGAPGSAPDVGRIADRADGIGAWEGGLLFLALFVLAIVTMPLQLSLVRLLEGYWGPFGERGRRRQRRLRAKLEEARTPTQADPSDEELARLTAADWTLRHRYPPAGFELPTALGNVLRSAEDRAGRRYGLDAVVAWPRLYPVLSDGVRALVDDQRDGLDLAARFCVVFALAALVSFGLLVTHPLWLLVPCGCVLLAWLAYRAAIAAALAYGEGIEAAFDLHRFDMLRALHLPLPEDRDAERASNQELSAFLRGSRPVPLAYEHGEERAPAT